MNEASNDIMLYALLLKKKQIECIDSLWEFTQYFWDVNIGDELIPNWHMKYICEELEILGDAIINKKSKPYDLIINVPPGSSKSTIVSQMFPVWLWLHNPKIVTISSSYSAELSIEHSIKSRNIIQSQKFHELFDDYFEDKFGEEIKLKDDQNNKTNWANNFGGARITASTGGTVTGRHADLILRDDPMSVKHAVSEAYRKTANDYNDQTLSSRKKNKKNTPTITIMQRLHEDDTTGHDLMKVRKNIKLICLPAELTMDVKPRELKQYYKSGLLDEKRMDREVLDEAKSDEGTYGYSSKYLQNPLPEEGEKLKKHWFEIVGTEKISPQAVVMFWIDGAYTKKNTNDPTGVTVATISGNDVYILDAVNKWMEFPELIEFLKDYIENQGYTYRSKIFIEPKASGKSIAQILIKETGFNVLEIRSPFVRQSKLERVDACSPTVQSGKIKLVRGPWNDGWLYQVSGFPRVKHDEQVDNLCYLIEHYIINRKVFIKKRN